MNNLQLTMNNLQLTMQPIGFDSDILIKIIL